MLSGRDAFFSRNPFDLIQPPPRAVILLQSSPPADWSSGYKCLSLPYGTLYCPNDRVTRGQLATFMARAMGIDGRTAKKDHFTDDSSNVHRGNINLLAMCLSTRSGPLCSSNLAHPKLLINKDET